MMRSVKVSFRLDEAEELMYNAYLPVHELANDGRPMISPSRHHTSRNTQHATRSRGDL